MYELYAIFNFAYFGSRQFNDTIDEKIFSSKKILSDRLNYIDGLISINKESIESIKSITIDSKTEVDLGKKLYGRLLEIESSYVEEKDKAQQKIRTLTQTYGFPKISLFSALFCITLLICSGFVESSYSPQAIFESLFYISLIHIVLVVAFLVNDTFDTLKKVDAMKSFHVLVLYVTLLGFLFIYNLICHFYGLKILGNLEYLVIWLTIVVPVIHFVFYFVRFLLTHKKSRKLAEELINEYDSKVNEISEEINNVSKAAAIIEDIFKTKE